VIHLYSDGTNLRRWSGQDLKQLRQTVPKEYLLVVEDTKRLIDELPQDGSHRLFELWKEVVIYDKEATDYQDEQRRVKSIL